MKRLTKEEGGGDGAEPLHKTLEWVQTFRAQLTKTLIHEAKCYARTQTKSLALVRPVDSSFPEEMVHDIIADTISGKIAWSPARVPLKKHIFDTIKSRAKHAYRRARRFRELPLKECDYEVEARIDAEQRRNKLIAAHRNAVFEAVRERAHDDPEILLILDAYDRRIYKRFAVMAFAHLTSSQFDNARSRIKRLVDQLPATFRLPPDEVE